METDLLDRVEIDPEVMLGKPVIRGTRITVEILLEKIAAGCSFDEVIADYPRLAREDVMAARTLEPRIGKSLNKPVKRSGSS